MIKAIALFSGGLDSILAVKIMESQGIVVFPLHIKHSFLPELDLRVKQEFVTNLIETDISKEFLKILKKPEHGYGKNLNPCLDCKILFYKNAKKYMKKLNADFIITGDVVGQRPFSQRKEAMNLIEKGAEVERFVVRPLTQRNLPMTIPEEKGWIDREKLYSIIGRKRQEQFKLAEKFGLKFIPTPAGGCLLTDRTFSDRTKLLMKFSLLTPLNIDIIKNGRLLVLSKKHLIIIGRNENENLKLENFFTDDKKDKIFIETIEPAGPSAIILIKEKITKNESEISETVNLLIKYIKSKEGVFLVKTETEEEQVKLSGNL